MNVQFYTLWAINGPLNIVKLKTQLDGFRASGFDGVVFHPRFYPGIPAYLGDDYLSIVSETILHAKSIGLKFWIYDEDGWPSGTVSGQMLERYPQLRQQWLASVPLDQRSAGPISRTGDGVGLPAVIGRKSPTGDNSLDALVHGNKQRDCEEYLVKVDGPGVDYFNPLLSRRFIEMTYDRYRTGLATEAFEHVSAFFCDEPEFGLGHAFDLLPPSGAIPWSDCIADAYLARYGERLDPFLIFFEAPDSFDVRVRFKELLTDIFTTSFITPINEWCMSHGKLFAMHTKGEEHPLFQTLMIGSNHQVLRHVSLPGIDALERRPSGHFFPKQAASVAQQFGTGDSMAESFGGSGWGATPEDLEVYLKWLAGHGINHFVLHLSQYELNTKLIRDWPPSMPFHVTWRAVFPQLFSKIREFAATVVDAADTLVVAPYRGIMQRCLPQELQMMNIHNAYTYAMTDSGKINSRFLALLDQIDRSGAPYHVCDERTVDDFGTGAPDSRLQVGQCKYSNVIIAEGAVLGKGSLTLIHDLDVEGSTSVLNGNAFGDNYSDPPATITKLRIDWNLRPVEKNTCRLEPSPEIGSEFIVCFDSDDAFVVSFEFADPVSLAELNNLPLSDDFTGSCSIGNNLLRFSTPVVGPSPFLTVSGAFDVVSETGYEPGPNNTIVTRGPFKLKQIRTRVPAQLISTGLPFYNDACIFDGSFQTTAATRSLTLINVSADCARVSVDSVDRGFCWGPDWTVSFPAKLAGGTHEISVELIPSSFNFYGPHHHIDGDIIAVSPSQFEYKKNFVDRADAPAGTRVPGWHFKPFGIAGSVTLQG